MQAKTPTTYSCCQNAEKKKIEEKRESEKRSAEKSNFGLQKKVGVLVLLQ